MIFTFTDAEQQDDICQENIGKKVLICKEK